MSSPNRDDRILPETHWIALVIVPFLFAAFVLLYFWPDNTAELFAWIIKPTMTPLIMGAGYIAGAYFFIRVFLEKRWHRVGIGFLSITAFTWFMGLATLLHWDKFNHGHVSFWAWLFLYLITPLLVPFLWWRNRHTDPGTPEPDDVIIPNSIRWAIVAVGAVEFIVALGMFVAPSFAISTWPWTLTPLTARVVAGWFALPGVLGLQMIVEQRWSALRITLGSQIIGLALILVGVVRAWSNFDSANPWTWLFVILIGLSFVGFSTLYLAMEARRGKIQTPQAGVAG
jgi:hypothetical protein